MITNRSNLANPVRIENTSLPQCVNNMYDFAVEVSKTMQKAKLSFTMYVNMFGANSLRIE